MAEEGIKYFTELQSRACVGSGGDEKYALARLLGHESVTKATGLMKVLVRFRRHTACDRLDPTQRNKLILCT